MHQKKSSKYMPKIELRVGKGSSRVIIYWSIDFNTPFSRIGGKP